MLQTRSAMHSDSPFIAALFPLLGFGVGLAIALYSGWNSTDLVWSFWLSSLFIGFATLILPIAGFALLIIFGAVLDTTKGGNQWGGLFIVLALALFLIAFFSLHFGAFHAGHAAFLHDAFPLPGVENPRFSAAFMNPPLLLSTAYQHVFPLYGWFLIAVIISEWGLLIGPLFSGWKKYREDGTKLDLAKLNGGGKGIFVAPYRNVVKIHLAILFVIPLAEWLSTLQLFVVIYAFFFFPWPLLWRFIRRDKLAAQQKMEK